MDFIKTYFQAEKSESLLFMLIGVLTITFSVYAIFKWGAPFYKGFAIPVVLIGLIQMVVGSTVYFRTDQQQQALHTLYKQNKPVFAQQETARMNKVMANFIIYKKIEIAFVLIGLLLMVFSPGKEFWMGLGVGMFMQGAIMLTCDIFAERRGHIYQNVISSEA
jgi:hypothetical protein